MLHAVTLCFFSANMLILNTYSIVMINDHRVNIVTDANNASINKYIAYNWMHSEEGPILYWVIKMCISDYNCALMCLQNEL